MKIAFLTPNLEFYGGNLVMLKYANFLVESGHEVTIISSDRKSIKEIDRRIKVLLYKSFPIRYVDFFLIQKIYHSKIARLIPECDVIIPIYTPLLPAAIKAKKDKRTSAKIVLFFQDCFEMLWAGYWIKKILSNRNNTMFIESAICVSSGAQKQLTSASTVKSVVINNGIDQDFYDRKLSKDNYLLFVGRPQKPKGFHVFKKAYRIAKASHPGLKAKVVAPNVEDGIVDGIEFVKYRSRTQLAEIYSKALIYVSASLAESFGLTPLEAMASKTPTVITKTLGSKEYATNLDNCIIANVGNAEELANGINRLLEDKKLAAKIVNKGLLTVQKYYWDNSLGMFLDILTQTVNSK